MVISSPEPSEYWCPPSRAWGHARPAEPSDLPSLPKQQPLEPAALHSAAHVSSGGWQRGGWQPSPACLSGSHRGCIGHRVPVWLGEAQDHRQRNLKQTPPHGLGVPRQADISSGGWSLAPWSPWPGMLHKAGSGAVMGAGVWLSMGYPLGWGDEPLWGSPQSRYWAGHLSVCAWDLQTG